MNNMGNKSMLIIMSSRAQGKRALLLFAVFFIFASASASSHVEREDEDEVLDGGQNDPYSKEIKRARSFGFNKIGSEEGVAESKVNFNFAVRRFLSK